MSVHEAENPIVVTSEGVLAAVQEHVALYDKSVEQHYDIISAFIKSVRGGDPNGSVYWLARMLDGGEDIGIYLKKESGGEGCP